MKNKFMRSVTAMVVAVTMLISSQGVVTSFADGGDHSDMSESSSVQMNEVGNNGTNQPTENGTGEDAAVKDVVEMINALPAAETITKETNLVSLKDQVNAARAAYDELSDDQKAAFNADVLGKLTALEAKISELESNDQETKPSDAVQTVVDAINALPAVETITEETDLVSLKDQVNAARAAYDALSAEQKESFDATVLEKLTALEAKISELESGEQETESSEAVQNVIEKIDAAVEQIDYTTETISATDGTTVTKTHITMLKDLDPANNAELKALIDKEAAHEQDETQPALSEDEAAKLSDARKAFEDAKAKYLSEGFSNAQLAARQAYDALAEADKTQVTNYSLLEAMEENIAYIMQAVNTLPTAVAEINGIPYDTLDDAVEKAEEGSTITLLKDCELTKGFNKTLTFNGTGKITIPQQLKSNGEGWMCFGLGDPSRVLTFDDVEVEWIAPEKDASWLMLQLNGKIHVDNGASLTFKFDSKATKTHCAIYMHNGSSIDVTDGSTFKILGFNTAGITGDAIQIDQSTTVNIKVSGKSTFLIDGTNRGYANAPIICVEKSTFTVQNCTSNASNGGDFTAIDSTILYQNNFGNGLSTRSLDIQNSNVASLNNGAYGVYARDQLRVDSSSTLDVIGNSWRGDWSGLQIGNSSDAIIKTGATVNIKDNKCSGLSNWGTCIFEEGVDLTITGNINDKGNTSRGGGIYNTKDTAHLTLPSDAVIYNNHAVTGGDDIYNTGEITFSRVGTDWILDDTNLPITGWYFDGNNNGTTTNRWSKSNYYELFNLFDESGKVTLTGTYALKAAHAYAYDPETPVNPTDWEHSKSKTATNLDANYQSQVTLSLPSSEYQLASDVVFVLDKSTSGNVKDDAIKMLESLKSDIEENGAKVNVGIVIFNQAASRFGWYDLITEYDQIIEIFNKEIKDGTNLNAGLLAAKEMLEEHTDVDPNRKHMILVSDGISYYYCEGTNYQQGYTIASLNGGDDGEGSRNCTPNSNLSAWGIKYGTYGADNEGFSYIPDWSQWESGMPALLSSDYTKYQYQVGSPDIPTEADSPKAVPFKERKNYPINVDISLYNSLKLYRDLASKYHCYAVLDGTTNKYTFGTPFMEYMAGETFVGSSSQEKFLNIKNDIFYLVDEGSSIVDVIGEGIDNAGNEYDFKFIDEADKLTLKVGNEVLPIHEENGYYGFGEKLTSGDYAGHYPYELTYYPEGMGTRSLEVAGELFRWDINVPVSNFAPVQLTYTVQLTNPQTADGTYGQYDADGSEEYAGLYTNKMAILYPVDSNGVEGEQEAFQKPTVSYSISNGKPVDPPVDPEDPTPRPGGGGDEDDDTPTIINDTPVPTTTIDDEDVPMADLPEDTVTIDDEEVPLKDIPNTGDMIPVPAMVAAVISIGGIALLMKKHK